jgi:hypothetical protein
MGDRIRQLVEKLIDKVRELIAPPMIPVPITPQPRPRR